MRLFSGRIWIKDELTLSDMLKVLTLSDGANKLFLQGISAKSIWVKWRIARQQRKYLEEIFKTVTYKKNGISVSDLKSLNEIISLVGMGKKVDNSMAGREIINKLSHWLAVYINQTPEQIRQGFYESDIKNVVQNVMRREVSDAMKKYNVKEFHKNLTNSVKEIFLTVKDNKIEKIEYRGDLPSFAQRMTGMFNQEV